MRSPDEIEAEQRKDEASLAYIAAAIDFLYCAGEDAERQQTRKNLGL